MYNDEKVQIENRSKDEQKQIDQALNHLRFLIETKNKIQTEMQSSNSKKFKKKLKKSLNAVQKNAQYFAVEILHIGGTRREISDAIYSSEKNK